MLIVVGVYASLSESMFLNSQYELESWRQESFERRDFRILWPRRADALANDLVLAASFKNWSLVWFQLASTLPFTCEVSAAET